LDFRFIDVFVYEFIVCVKLTEASSSVGGAVCISKTRPLGLGTPGVHTSASSGVISGLGGGVRHGFIKFARIQFQVVVPAYSSRIQFQDLSSGPRSRIMGPGS